MASDSKSLNSTFNIVTKETESRHKLNPEHIFDVFLELHEPQESTSDIVRKYPEDFSDDLLKSVSNFAYPCKKQSDEQSEMFTFSILDPSGTLFRYGFCRRSNREATCLCLISYHPWFELFYNILNDLFVLINGKSSADVERYLSLLYNYRLMSNEEFFSHEGKEIIEIKVPSKNFTYERPDPRRLPSMLSSLNFTVMCTRLGPDILLHLFSHLLFERRILFVSSKLFHLSACVYGCQQMIYPMHWQSIFLPILPASMSWTTQCTAPYIIGIHSSVFSTLNIEELGDVVIVKIDERQLESQHDDLSIFPKYLLKNLKKGIDHSSNLAGDHLARVFLRAMAFSIGHYAAGFLLKNEKHDFDRDLYLEQFRETHVYSYMSAVANTQMFEQFSRYRVHAQLEREIDVDDFDLELKQIQEIKKSKKNSKKLYKILEKYVKDGPNVNTKSIVQRKRGQSRTRQSLIDTKFDRSLQAANPLLEQVQNKAEKLQTVINKAGQKVVTEASSVMSDRIRRNPSSSSKTNQSENQEPITVPQAIADEKPPDENNNESSSESSRASTPLIDLEPEDNPLLPSPIVLNVIHTEVITPTPRPVPQIDSKIKRLQDELQYKVQTFDGKRLNPRDEYGEQQSDIRRLVKQFDPLCDDNDLKLTHSSNSTPPRKNNDLQSSRPRMNFSGSSIERHPSIYQTIPNHHISSVLQTFQMNHGINHRFLAKNEQPTGSSISTDVVMSFDPLAPSSESKKKSDETNLIDFD